MPNSDRGGREGEEGQDVTRVRDGATRSRVKLRTHEFAFKFTSPLYAIST